jgi:hypothetical protein
VAIVTAAGYPGNSERFEQRLAGLLDVFAQEKLPQHLCDRFYVMVRCQLGLGGGTPRVRGDSCE